MNDGPQGSDADQLAHRLGAVGPIHAPLSRGGPFDAVVRRDIRCRPMDYEHVIWELDDGVGRVTLNRPDTLNAWHEGFGRELKQVITGEAAEDSVRAVLITGAGRGFSSGADLKSGFEPDPEDGMPNIRKELHEL